MAARNAMLILVCGCVVLSIAMGVRHGFGLYLPPMSTEYGWGREVFAFALAVQNLVWGAAQPFAGLLADRYGAARTILGGTILYVAGLVLMAMPGTPFGLSMGAGVLIGLGLSGTTFAVVLGAVARAVPPEKRSLALGIGGAAGSFGQFALMPASLWLILGFGWSMALMLLAVLAAVMAPLAFGLREPGRGTLAAEMTAWEAVGEASRSRGFWLLCFGFFVCGFQVVFIGIHLPAYFADNGLPAETATVTLALVGLFNIVGSYLAGWWGGRRRKPLLLAGIYAARGVVIAAFITLPLTTWSAYAFGVAMGFLWLSTVPLTNGTVASVFGVRNMAMLGGAVFFFHQVGSFLGGWLGGWVYDRTGSYDAIWYAGIALSVVATLVNLPIREEPVARLATRPA
jgi:MFS family permease